MDRMWPSHQELDLHISGQLHRNIWVIYGNKLLYGSTDLTPSDPYNSVLEAVCPYRGVCAGIIRRQTFQSGPLDRNSTHELANSEYLNWPTGKQITHVIRSPATFLADWICLQSFPIYCPFIYTFSVYPFKTQWSLHVPPAFHAVALHFTQKSILTGFVRFSE
jgi:hypothetical protein